MYVHPCVTPARFTDDVLYMSPIFIATVPLRREFVRNRELCLNSMEYSLHPVFRIMKCIGETTGRPSYLIAHFVYRGLRYLTRAFLFANKSVASL